MADRLDTPLAELVDATGLTRARLAHVLGCSRTTLQNRISGYRGERRWWSDMDVAVLEKLTGWPPERVRAHLEQRRPETVTFVSMEKGAQSGPP